MTPDGAPGRSPVPAGPALVSAHDLVCVRGGRRILDGVSLELPPGQLLAVVGPNGAGKTSLIRLLSGVTRPDAGRIELGGVALGRLSFRERALRLGVVPQELVVEFPYSVREMVAMGRAPHLRPMGNEGPADRARITAALEELGLVELASRAYPTLSGGERQRVALARVRAQEAPCLLLDEPTSHMDLGQRLHAFEWLRRWCAGSEAGRSALVVTHDLGLAARFSDAVILLHQGRAVAVGPPGEVLNAGTIRDVYRVDVHIELDAQGRPRIVAERSRIVYTSTPDE